MNQLDLNDHGKYEVLSNASSENSSVQNENPGEAIVIAHRGYSAKQPENTLASFREAAKAGIRHIEADVRLTKDEVVAISHDRRLKRMYGVDTYVHDIDYEHENGHFRTIREPYEPLPTFHMFLTELLKYRGVQLYVDIKPDVDIFIIPKMVDCMLNINLDLNFWADKVIFCIWSRRFLPACDKYAPTIKICHIGFNFSYAQQYFLMHPRVIGVNMAVALLLLPSSQDFIEMVHALNKKVITWSVNTPAAFYLSLKRNCDGVITDDPVVGKALCNGPILTKTWYWFDYKEWFLLLIGFLRVNAIFYIIRNIFL
ncbi:glycerophosphoryl diester phosphodiesterase [Schizosaccharomyces cryophilus OY26]|uniref:Glycerophosphoryl diester phosphodiesterase n=1 Tax=Schizosaccharomyces cryophilus (strain OY26 / ATCC MYA-4695 / CBS 11777 / NBRC 106824 / NRRL Y48691) TaxID=653667 RepID=S9W3Q9_SCHCR|nr:glycerophosphoryl diester phosphodiesterase [Schizosaccharomyces cryophilus OY26]EPY53174.1 glycerophosphoryl diester phosphodiesterase [Schizosaccharomyces cryophilus OY26]